MGMPGKDLRFEPMKEQDGFAIIPDTWKVDFYASAGELSRFFIELKDNARLMGTRCPRCGSVYCWPRSWCHDCYEDCDWVEMSGKGRVQMFGTVFISLSELQTEVPYCAGGVLLDGARYPLINYFRDIDFAEIHPGMPVRAEFLVPEKRLGSIRDFYFVPDQGA